MPDDDLPDLVTVLAGMKADLMLHHHVVNMWSLEERLHAEEQRLDALTLIEGVKLYAEDNDDGMIGELDGTVFN